MADKKEKGEFGHDILIKGNKCYRCEHKWVQREEAKPSVCPHCKSPYWDRPKTKFNKDEKK